MDKTCDTCGRSFTAARADARYCGGRCRTEAYRARREGPKPKARRRPLPDVFLDAARDVERKVERLDRLTQDDRLHRNRELISARHHYDLVRARESLDRVIEIVGQPARTS